MKRFMAIVFVLAVLIAAFSFPVSAQSPKTGTDFANYYSYSTTKTLTQMPRTMEAWINYSGATSNVQSIFGNFRSTNTNSFSLRVQSGTPRVLLASLYDMGESAHTLNFTQVRVQAGQWTYLAVTFDVDNQKAHCYIDGELKQTLNISKVQLEAIKSIDFVSDNKTHLSTLGSSHASVGSSSRRDFLGEIASFAAYSDVRTADEIKKDMESYSSPDKNSLMFAYEFKEKGCESYTDLSGNKTNLGWAGRDFVRKEDVSEPDKYDYSITIVGDTQAISKTPDTTAYYGLYDWISNNISSKKIQAVIGVGDITNNNTDEQWERAKTAFAKINNKVLHFPILGNHDNTDKYGGVVGIYKNYVPFNKTSTSDSYDGTIKSHYKEFKIGDTDWLILGLSYGPTTEELDWAKEVLLWHPKHNVILTTHAYLDGDGTILQKDAAPKIQSELVQAYSNIVMVVCGHMRNDNVLLFTETRADGTTVQALFTNPQDADASVPGGLATMLYFSENSTKVQVRNYATALDCYLGQDSCVEFNLDLVGNRKEPEKVSSEIVPVSSTQETVSDEVPVTTTPSEEKFPVVYIIIGGAVLVVLAVVIVLVIKKKK